MNLDNAAYLEIYVLLKLSPTKKFDICILFGSARSDNPINKSLKEGNMPPFSLHFTGLTLQKQ